MAVAEAMARFVGLVVKDKQPQMRVGGSGFARASVIKSYAVVLRGEEAAAEEGRPGKKVSPNLVRFRWRVGGERSESWRW